MNIRILSFRNSTLKEVAALEQNYLKRLRPSVSVSLIDLKIGRESGKRLLKSLEGREKIIVLDARGKVFNSEKFAGLIQNFQLSGVSGLAFVIGGPDGLCETVKKRADVMLQLSSLTLPHQLVRLILLEALYRSFDLLGPRRYHK